MTLWQCIFPKTPPSEWQRIADAFGYQRRHGRLPPPTTPRPPAPPAPPSVA